MLIVMDVGNTNTVIGVYEGHKLISDWRIRTEKETTADEYGVLLRNLFQSQNLNLEAGTDSGRLVRRAAHDQYPG